MPPIRRVVFLGPDDKPIPPAPSQPTPLEREAQGPPQRGLLDFEESSAPAPRTASVYAVELPAQVGAAQELRRLRHSNELHDASRRLRRRQARTRARRPARTVVTRRRTTAKRVSRPRHRVIQRTARPKARKATRAKRTTRRTRTR